MAEQRADEKYPSKQQFLAVFADGAFSGTLLYATVVYLLGIPNHVAFVVIVLSATAALLILAPRIRRGRFHPVRGGSLLYAPAAVPLWLALAGALFSLFSLTRGDNYGFLLGFSATLAGALLGKFASSKSAA